MNSNKPPLYKKIKTPLNYYIYDTWTNEILKVDPAVFDYLDDTDPPVIPNFPNVDENYLATTEEIETAKKNGYFNMDYPSIDSFPKENIDLLIDNMVKEGPDLLILNITEQCNLRCKYCAYSGAYVYNRTHSNKRMNRDTAYKAVNWYLGHSERSEYHFGFYGGEPLLSFPLIREIVDFVKEKTGDHSEFNITTNGTLLNDKVCRFLIDQNIHVLISLDGPAEVHDRYRNNSKNQGTFSIVWDGISRLWNMNRDFFEKNVLFNMVLAPPQRIKEIQDFILANPDVFRKNSITISSLNPQPSNVMEHMGISNQDCLDTEGQANWIRQKYIQELTESACPDEFTSAYYNRQFVFIHQRSMTTMAKTVASHGQCIPGGRKCFISSDGKMYMCERVNYSRQIGSVETGIDRSAVEQLLREYNDFFKNKCSDCWAVRLCQKCYNNVSRGEAFSPEELEIFCSSRRNSLQRALTTYCEIREINNNAFDWAEEIVLK